MIKYCEDCRWCDLGPGDAGEFATCNKILPGSTRVMRNQGVKQRYKYCSTLRLSDWLFARLEGICGRRGRFWEPK